MGQRFILTEQDRISILKMHKLLKEDYAKDKASTVYTQQDILTYEYDNLTEVYWLTDTPSGCMPPNGSIYKPGETNKPCMIRGSKLCGGKDCFQSQAVDGIWGPNTTAAMEAYKDKPSTKCASGTTIGSCAETKSNKDENSSWYKSRAEVWNIPAGWENIRAFQYFVWGKIEKDNERDPNDAYKYKTMLCGNNFCTVEKAVDGSWGTNTKKAWGDYKQDYFDAGYDTATEYEEVYRDLNP